MVKIKIMIELVNVSSTSEKIADTNCSTELNLHKKDIITRLMSSNQEILPGIECVGCGYNMQGGAANSKYVKNSLFDASITKVKEFTFLGKKYDIFDFMEIGILRETNYAQTTAVSSKEFQKKISEHLKIEGAYEGFSASLTTGFDKNTTNSSTNSFTTIEDFIHLYFTRFNIEKFRPYLRPEVKTLINSGDTNVLFKDFGTHFVAGAIIGAKASISLTFDKYENNITSETTVDAKAGFLGLISGENNITTNDNKKIALSSGQINVQVFGGDTNIDPQSLLTNDGFKHWVETVHVDNCVLVDFSVDGSNPLVGVWELADTMERRIELQLEANAYIKKHQHDSITRNPVDYLISVETGHKDYAGTGKYVSIEIVGDLGRTDKIDLDKNGKFKEGSTNEFYFNLLDLGNLQKIIVHNGNYDKKVSNPGWLLNKVNVVAGVTESNKDSLHHYKFEFKFNNWLKTDKGYSKTASIPVTNHNITSTL